MTIADPVTEADKRGYPYRYGVLIAHLGFLITAFEQYVNATITEKMDDATLRALGAIAEAQEAHDAAQVPA